MNQSITSRIFWSIGLTFVRAGLNFATGLLLARFLGAAEFGRFAFLIATFIAIRQLTDLAASNAFFTFLSERRRSPRFVLYYWGFVAAQIIFCVGLLAVLLPQTVLDRVWQGETRGLLILACLAAYSQYSIWAAAAQMGDANRETKTVQIVNTLIMAAHFVAVILLYNYGLLALPVLFGLIILEWILGSLAIRTLYVYSDPSTTDQPGSAFPDVLKSYVTYCKPLLLLTFAVFAFTFADRWMLQTWSGSEDQAYLALGLQFASISLLAVTSVLRILWKEVSEAHSQQNHALLRMLYHRSVRILFAISLLVSATVIPWFQTIVTTVLGPDYQSGLVAMMLLMLVPVGQSLGQVTGTLLLATHRTAISARIGIAFAAINLVASYVIMAPQDHAFLPGFGLGVEGLAVKLVVLGFTSVWTIGYFLKRDYGQPAPPIYQVVATASAVAVSFGVYYSLSFLTGFMQIGLHGTVMVCLFIGLVLLRPSVLHLKPEIVRSAVGRIYPPLLKWLE